MLVAGRDLAACRAVCRIDDTITYPVTGAERPLWVTAAAADEGDPVAMTTYGPVSHDGWSFDAGQPVFLGTYGQLIKTANGNPVGVASSATVVVLV